MSGEGWGGIIELNKGVFSNETGGVYNCFMHGIS